MGKYEVYAGLKSNRSKFIWDIIEAENILEADTIAFEHAVELYEADKKNKSFEDCLLEAESLVDEKLDTYEIDLEEKADELYMKVVASSIDYYSNFVD